MMQASKNKIWAEVRVDKLGSATTGGLNACVTKHWNACVAASCLMKGRTVLGYALTKRVTSKRSVQAAMSSSPPVSLTACGGCTDPCSDCLRTGKLPHGATTLEIDVDDADNGPQTEERCSSGGALVDLARSSSRRHGRYGASNATIISKKAARTRESLNACAGNVDSSGGVVVSCEKNAGPADVGAEAVAEAEAEGDAVWVEMARGDSGDKAAAIVDATLCADAVAVVLACDSTTSASVSSIDAMTWSKGATLEVATSSSRSVESMSDSSSEMRQHALTPTATPTIRHNNNCKMKRKRGWVVLMAATIAKR